MAAKVETLRTTTGRTTAKRGTAALARFGLKALEWMRSGRLGETDTAEMRRYTGAR